MEHSVNGPNDSKINSFDSDKTGVCGWVVKSGYYVDGINATCRCVRSESLQKFNNNGMVSNGSGTPCCGGNVWQDLAETNNKTQPPFLVSFLEKRFHEDLDLRD
ncbi:hypothetical protein CDAR_110171 [Caerostris darwini]|uniref:Uncharacterized protein n=1 Tax=Caerostris darwini TaxID=1538125 RepID=A0AAV4S788_9ARAC|nr:hypothetical protein CDAR_110171 [Caerostris darwini]